MTYSLKKFNQRQKEAVLHENGALLVISGAGTGKTRLITGRILNLILNRKISPDSILALTFTEKAAVEMLTRVESELPIGFAELWIKTFHGFCDTVLRERGHEIGLSTNYKILKGADLNIFLRKHILDLGLDYYRPLGSPYKFLDMLCAHFGRLKDEDIQPEEYEKHAQKLKKSARNEEEMEAAAKMAELAAAYGKYEKLLTENGYFDFGSLLFYTLRLFESRPSVLAEYRERFKFIMVDEFQDTNFAQNRIVTLLAEKHKNIMVVGDDDQSIYKWRGASLTNTAYFNKMFPGAAKIVLDKNYRSTQKILDLSYGVIQKNNPERLEFTEGVIKKMTANCKSKALSQASPPRIYHFEKYTDEIDFVISEAARSLQSGLETAILVRTNGLGSMFAENLKNAGVPMSFISSSSIFSKKIVKDCLALLKYLSNPADDIALFRLATIPLFGIKMETLRLAVGSSKHELKRLWETMADKQFLDLKNHLTTLLEYSRDNPVSLILMKFLEDTKYIETLKDEENVELVEDLRAFSQLIRNFETQNPNAMPEDFVAFAGLMEESDESRPMEGSFDDESVKILTIHGAKGLEFDAVFVPGLVQGKFPATARWEPFIVPDELIKESLPKVDHRLQEERRLFYVALTRARENITLTYSDFYEGKKNWKPSVFVLEATENGLKEEKVAGTVETTAKKAEIATRVSTDAPAKKISRVSYTQIRTFDECPLKYKFEYIFSLKSPNGVASNFGKSVHGTLNDFYSELIMRKSVTGTNLTPLLEKCYDKNWISSGYDSAELEIDQKKRGLRLLKKFIKKDIGNITLPALLEQKFELTLGGITIGGRIDRIDKLPDGTYEVIDYKTGSVKKESLKSNLQLAIYALACQDSLKLSISKLSLYYIESAEKISIDADKIDLDKCTERILETAKHLGGPDYIPTPGFQCSYCEFRLLCPVAK